MTIQDGQEYEIKTWGQNQVFIIACVPGTKNLVENKYLLDELIDKQASGIHKEKLVVG